MKSNQNKANQVFEELEGIKHSANPGAKKRGREKLEEPETNRLKEGGRGRRGKRERKGDAIGGGVTGVNRRPVVRKAAEKKFAQVAPRGYLLTSFSVPQSCALFVNEGLQTYNLHPDDQAFLKHVLVSGGFRTNTKGGWVPVASDLIRRELPKTNPRHLCEVGLLERTDYSIVRGKSREYRIANDWLRRGFYDLLRSGLKESGLMEPRVDLFTGRPSRAGVRSVLYDRWRHAHPGLVTAAILLIERNGLCNMTAAQAALERFRELDGLWREKARIEAPGSPEHAHAEERAAYWESVTNHNTLCLNTVRINTVEDFGNGIVRYKIPYEPTSTGRLKHPQESKGGPLNFSRDLKAYVYSGIQVYNYDLENSQLVALYTLLEQAGIESEWLTDYLTHPGGKTPYFTRAKVTKDAYKTILYAVLFGSPLPPPSGKAFEGEVWNVVEEVPISNQSSQVFRRKPRSDFSEAEPGVRSGRSAATRVS
ncbi:MAG: hypothetical protein SFU83_15095 [Meiothermus sp.]|nr:hypothetical protein [Meiothermus sp.]